MSVDRTVYKFGNFEFDPSESSLLESGRTVSITPKALRLLAILTENPGHVLDKSYLLDQIWEDSYVEEGNLTYNIRQLRKILGDEVKNPRYIETVPKRGYRFVGSVERIEQSNGVVPTPLPPEPKTVVLEQQNSSRPRLKPWLLAIPVILAAGSIAAVESWFGSFDPHTTKLLSTPFSSERLSTDGNVRHAVLSKAGDLIVYVAGSQDGKQSLRIRDLSTGQSREFLGSTEDRYIGLEMSPDGSSLYFVRIAASAPDTACLFKVRLTGGVPESLGCGLEGWFDISDDGKNISYVRCRYDPDDYCSLYVSDEKLANERLLVTRRGRTRIGDNAISPDGRSVVFAAGQSVDGSNDFGIYQIDLDTNIETPVVDQKFFNVVSIDWMPDGGSLLATALLASDDDIYFWSVVPSTRTATPVKQNEGSFATISMDREGLKLVSTVRSADFRVFVHSFDPDTKPVALGSGWTPRFTPNGRVLFASNRSGRVAIWSAFFDGTDVKHLSTGTDEFPILSADGSTIYFTSKRSGSIHVWKMQTDGSGATQLSRGEGGFPVGVSADGFWIYYLSAMYRTLHRVSNNGAIEEKVTEGAMHGADISADARFAAFFDGQPRGAKITIAALESDAKPVSVQLPRADMKGKHLAWSANGDYIYAVLFDPLARTYSVWRLAIDGSAPQKIRDLNVQELGERSSFSVSPDERHFAIAMGEWKHDAVLVHGLK
ncbi:MAG: winged helix-turn-helix domain-containing protein [Acidobacteria bacterium]|nr:winged helix-turn-helix domain-containing protein [Acidobacteriota bacterium]